MDSHLDDVDRNVDLCENGHGDAAWTFGANTDTADVKFTGLIANGSDGDSSSAEETDVAENRRGNDSSGRQFAVSRERSVQRSATAPDIQVVLQIKDDHFAPPEGCTDACTIEELEACVENYKARAKLVTPHTDQAKDLIRKLVQLRLKLLEAKEPVITCAAGKRVMGHLFFDRPWGRAEGHYCEKCNGLIMGIVQSWLMCQECGFCCHKRCLNLITRTCARVKVLEKPVLSLTICPEKGLHAQNYRCMECRKTIGFQPGLSEPRLCDYTGAFYCDHCHWNDTMIIPARILNSWDFEPRKVCRHSRQFLRLMSEKPVLCPQDFNPVLFTYLSELSDIRKLREEILIMKQYFLQCAEALRVSKLLCQLQDRQHFVENSDLYSLQDLLDLANDILLPEIAKIHTAFAQHIKTDCEKCRMKGYICAICENEEILFPFDYNAFVCPDCSTVLHRDCYMQKNQRCSLCLKKKERTTHSSKYEAMDAG